MKGIILKSFKSRINRYIMECKYEIIASFTGSETGINRYIMECKSVFLIWQKRVDTGINRYIMECKLRYLSSGPLGLR